jgi:hypothetical protein
MTDTFKATPEQWQASERRAANGHSNDLRFLELRARVEALEAHAGNLKGSLASSTPPFVGPVATDEELDDTWHKAVTAPGGTFLAPRRALYNLGVAHGQASRREVAEPAPVSGGLVARVIYVICGTNHAGIDWSPEARAAILEVAKWLREQEWEKAADLLEQEAVR